MGGGVGGVELTGLQHPDPPAFLATPQLAGTWGPRQALALHFFLGGSCPRAASAGPLFEPWSTKAPRGRPRHEVSEAPRGGPTLRSAPELRVPAPPLSRAKMRQDPGSQHPPQVAPRAWGPPSLPARNAWASAFLRLGRAVTTPEASGAWGSWFALCAGWLAQETEPGHQGMASRGTCRVPVCTWGSALLPLQFTALRAHKSMLNSNTGEPKQ